MRKLLIAIPVAITVGIALTGCGAPNHKFTLTVDSDMSTGAISMGTDRGIEQGNGASTPYSNSIQLSAGHTVSVTAQADSAASFISCKITDETGRVYADNRSSGAYSMVSCAATSGY